VDDNGIRQAWAIRWILQLEGWRLAAVGALIWLLRPRRRWASEPGALLHRAHEDLLHPGGEAPEGTGDPEQAPAVIRRE
jgi:hypothetical protein